MRQTAGRRRAPAGQAAACEVANRTAGVASAVERNLLATRHGIARADPALTRGVAQTIIAGSRRGAQDLDCAVGREG